MNKISNTEDNVRVVVAAALQVYLGNGFEGSWLLDTHVREQVSLGRTREEVLEVMANAAIGALAGLAKNDSTRADIERSLMHLAGVS
ncbi:MAG: hypothetical protein EB060_10630 [Proteobacteria bacterium]|nr:hypothetical protein [Pseudomonadota bacterium]